MDKIVTGCGDCPLCHYTDKMGYSCLMSGVDEFGQWETTEEDEYNAPITPDWYPLKSSPITITLKQE